MSTALQTSVPPPRLTGACACCGAPTRSLFAMGHDARFRGVLQRALGTSGDWDAEVPWYLAPQTQVSVTVADALARIATLVGKDWTERVSAGAARVGKRPGVAAPVLAPASSVRPARPFDAQALTDARVEELMAALNSHPLAGQWGWLATSTASAPARVQHTRRFARDEEPSSLVDFFVPELGRVLERVDPALWRRDESARS